MTACLPKATYDEERNVTFCSQTEMISLNIQDVPISMTFGIFDSYVHTPLLRLPVFNHVTRTHVIADPTSFEEPLLDSNVTIVLRGDETISVSQGGLGTSQKTAADDPVKLLSDCVDAAKRRQNTVQQLLMEALRPIS
jgi:exosome complex component RRP43